MDISELHPELRKTYSRIPTLPLQRAPVRWIVRTLMNLVPNKAKSVPGIAVEDRQLSNCAVRIYRPESNASGAGLVWIHAGGYVMGNTGMNDGDCINLARELGLVVVSVNYRLAPGHPFPAAHEDCLAAWNFLVEAAPELGVDPKRIAVLGQSAGGGLAAGLVQRIADSSEVQPAAQVLMYPMLDDRPAANTALDEVKHRFFDNKSNRGGWECYLGQAAGADTVPPYAVAARREDLSGLPPTWIGVGDVDLLYAEDCEYAERLRAAGVNCQLHIADRAPHAYDAMAPDSSVSQETRDSVYQFLREHLNL